MISFKVLAKLLMNYIYNLYDSIHFLFPSHFRLIMTTICIVFYCALSSIINFRTFPGTKKLICVKGHPNGFRNEFSFLEGYNFCSWEGSSNFCSSEDSSIFKKISNELAFGSLVLIK